MTSTREVPCSRASPKDGRASCPTSRRCWRRATRCLPSDGARGGILPSLTLTCQPATGTKGALPCSAARITPRKSTTTPRPLEVRDGCFSQAGFLSHVFSVTPVTVYAHAKGDLFGHTSHRFAPAKSDPSVG